MNTRIVLGALLIICSFGTLTPIGIIIIFWEYFKKAIKIDFYTVYLVMRLIIWFVIQLPLGLLKVGTGAIGATFHKAISVLTHKPRLNGFFFVLSLSIALFLFPTPAPSSFLDLGALASSLRSFVVILGFSTFSTILLDVTYVTLSGKEIAKINPADTSASEYYSGMKGGLQESAEGVKTSKKVYNAIDPEEVEDTTEAVLKFWKEDDIQAILKSLGELLPGTSIGGKAAAKKTAQKAGVEAAETLGMGTLGPVIVVAFVFVIVQWIALIIVLGAYLQFILPMIATPIMGALGIGESYANWIGGEVGDRFLAGVTVEFDQYLAPVMEAKQRVLCIAQGPACFRRWQNNNTQTPDSQNVGETYSLQLDRFEVGSGDQVDIAYQDGDYSPPISFGLSNSRNGLYGINAYNVSYRIRIIDFQRDGIGSMDPYCTTGWAPINGYNIRESGDPDAEYYGNDLYPGTSASTGFMRLEDINLENCGLLQPGLGETKTVLLEVKYDYYSEATLYFEAMARQVMRQQPDVNRQWKASETADTPVKSILNVNSPVLFDQNDPDLDEAAEPFDMRTALQTEESDVEYKINHIEVVKSSQVEISDQGSEQCQLETKQGNNELLVPTGDAADILSGSGNSRWYSAANPPPFFGCTMELAEPAEINPEGQTLSMDVRSNYTVKLNQQLERFRIQNSRCSGGEFNCPLLVTEQFAEERENPDNWKTTCTGPDATDGCVVVEGDPDEWSNVRENLMTGNDLLDYELEDGEYALNPFEWRMISEERKTELRESINLGEDDSAAIGLTETQYQRMERGKRGFTIVSMMTGSDGVGGSGIEREVQYLTLEEPLCAERDGDMVERYREKTDRGDFLSDEETRVVVFRPELERCSNDDTSSGSGSDVPHVGSP